MKRITALLLSAVLAASMLAACGKEPDSVPAGDGLLVPPAPTGEANKDNGKMTVEKLRQQKFSDLTGDEAGFDAACYCAYYQILEPSDGAFGAYDMVTRSMAADALWRMGGKKGSDAVTWCADVGILDGFASDDLSGQTPLTRQELASVLFYAAEYMGIDPAATGDLSAYQDGDSVKNTQTMVWALTGGALKGIVAQDRIQPKVPVSRMQLAQALVHLVAMDGGDPLAVEISQAMPEREASASQGNHDAIARRVEAIAKEYGAQGLQVAVVENGVLTDTYAYGWATRETDPMTADHKLRIASISKVFVGTSAMLLVEDGKVDLDEDISRFWGCTVKNPKYPNKPITVRNMMTHTSSIFNGGDNVSRKYENVRSRLQGSGYSGAEPGNIANWEYNNYAYSVLGMTLELAAKETLNNYLERRLFQYMDMDAAFGAGDLKNTDMIATVYRYGASVGRSVADQKNSHSSTTPAGNGTLFPGGLTTSVTDLGKFLSLLAGGGVYEGVRLMDAASLEEMEKQIETPTSNGSYQAHPMRYWPDLYGREGIYFHTGSAYGVFNCFCYDPYTGDGVAVLTTGTGGAKDDWGIYKVCAEINNHIFRVIE